MGSGARTRPMARLPLQVGTTATWAVARAAITFVPGLALLGVGVSWFLEGGSSGELEGAIAICGGLFITSSVLSLRLALKTRASDLQVFSDWLRLEGGPQHATQVPWKELTSPWAGVEQTKVERLVLWRMPLTALFAVGGEGFDPTKKVDAWRLWVMRDGKRVDLGETDRPGEAASFRAAAATIAAVCEGQRHLETAKKLKTEFASCPRCNAALVPDDADQVVCSYCKATVPLPERFRKQAASAKIMQGARARTSKMIHALVEQPGASRSNFWLLLLTLVMFAAWPVGWFALARGVLADGFQTLDVAFAFSPLAGIAGAFLFARGRLADRGALQLLTLGFGALAPERPGDPSLCRRCHGPLPDVGVGGVAACRYCEAENIVGIDLRPVVDSARTEQKRFDRALQRRRRERLLWGVLSVVALAVLAAWLTATVEYVKHPPKPSPVEKKDEPDWDY